MELIEQIPLIYDLFTLLDLDTDSYSDLDCKPNGYIVLCIAVHTAWSRIPFQILTANYRNGIRIEIRIGIRICECK